jgi:hypothetical protein
VLQNSKSAYMISQRPIEDLKTLPKKEKKALAIMLRLLPQTPESLQTNDLENNILNLLRRVMKCLSE